MRFIFALALLLFFAGYASSPPLWAQVKQNISYDYYPVTPQPGRSLYHQLYEDTPLRERESGKKITGQATWSLKYERNIKEISKGKCRLDSYKVFSTCNISLPKLMSNDPKLRRDFNAYMTAYLHDHEMTHCKIAADYANRLHAEFKALPTMDCQEINSAVKETFQRAFADAQAAQKAFEHEDSIQVKKLSGEKVESGSALFGKLLSERRKSPQGRPKSSPA